MRLVALCAFLGCLHLPVRTPGDAIAIAKQARVTIAPEDDCVYQAHKIDTEFWVVQLEPNPDSKTIGLDCWCSWRVYVDAIQGKATCALCGNIFAFKKLDGRESCDRFFPDRFF